MAPLFPDNPLFLTAAYCPPELGGLVASWGWTLSGPEGKIVASDAGFLDEPKSGWYEEVAQITAIAQALQWARENGCRNVTVLSSSAKAMGQVLGFMAPPVRCKPAYREILQMARDLREQAEARIAWTTVGLEAPLNECKRLFLELIENGLGGKTDELLVSSTQTSGSQTPFHGEER
jgi:ribonuclease HI